VNRNKRSVTLDLKADAGKRLLWELLEDADVLVSNFRPGVMERLGLGAEALCERNPRLVYTSVSGFGQTGSEASRPAYDIIVQAMSGLMDLTGSAEGPPTMVGEAVADVAGGLFASWGIMAALFERERTCRGRFIDVALADSLVSMMPTAAARVLLAGDTPVRTGNKHALSAPFGVYAAGEGHFAVAVLNDKLFAGFCAAIGRPELVADLRLGCDSDRRANEPVLSEAIESWAASHTAESAAAVLADAGIPAAPLASVREAWTSDRTASRELVSQVSHRDLGDICLPEQPVHFQGSPRGGRCAAPGLDEHGAQIRAELEV